MKSVRCGVFMFLGKARGYVIATCDRRQMPCEGKDVSPMTVLMELGPDQRHVPRSKRPLEGCEPILGKTPGACRGLIFKEGLIEVVHSIRSGQRPVIIDRNTILLRWQSARRTPVHTHDQGLRAPYGR